MLDFFANLVEKEPKRAWPREEESDWTNLLSWQGHTAQGFPLVQGAECQTCIIRQGQAAVHWGFSEDWRLNISSTEQCLLPLFLSLTGIIHPSIIPSIHLPIHHHPYIHKYIRFLSPLVLPLGWREAGANPSCLMLRAELHFGLRKELWSLEQGWLVERML